jgi:rRNA maturation protein Nop10
MPYIREPCPECGTEIEVAVNQVYNILDELHWFKGYNCPVCGSQFEVDGWDETPEGIRQSVLAAYGTWELVVNETEHRATQAVSILRAALNLTLAEAGRLRKHIPGPVATGTRGEMERLKAHLSKKGLSTQSRERT